MLIPKKWRRVRYLCERGIDGCEDEMKLMFNGRKKDMEGKLLPFLFYFLFFSRYPPYTLPSTHPDSCVTKRNAIAHAHARALHCQEKYRFSVILLGCLREISTT